MSARLIIHKAGPGVSLQDQGRSGYLACGLSRGGAADATALVEGAALLGQSGDLAVLEMAGTGGQFEVTAPARIALTGAPMRADVDGKPMIWNASHAFEPGQVLTIGAVQSGTYGYLHVGGGIDAPLRHGARSSHLAAGLGGPIAPGTELPIGADGGGPTGLALAPAERFGGGTLRFVPSLQTALFADQLDRFQATSFARDARANRMGVRLISDSGGFQAPGGLNILSEVIVPGDIQVTGDGNPYVLMSECQTTGGYPRIGTVIPANLPRVAQTQPGETLRFSLISLDQALAAHKAYRQHLANLPGQCTPLIRDVQDISDLLSYQLISGAITGDTEAETD